eukprot:g3942.t1
MLYSRKTKTLICLIISLAAVNAYDFLYFAQEWSPGACAYEDCRAPDLQIPNVLGLFPHFLNNTWPLYCNKSLSFDIDKIKDLSEILHEKIVAQYRHNIYHDNDELYWEDLWLMHGTCMNFSQADYFFMTIQLAHRFNFKEALAEEGIIPSDGRLYKTERFQTVLSDAIGAPPQLECTGRDLTRVWICLDSNFDAIECPIKRPMSCDDLISFHASSKRQSGETHFNELLHIDSAPDWVSNWLIPIGLMLLLISNVILGYRLAQQYFQKKNKSIESEPILAVKV